MLKASSTTFDMISDIIEAVRKVLFNFMELGIRCAFASYELGLRFQDAASTMVFALVCCAIF